MSISNPPHPRHIDLLIVAVASLGLIAIVVIQVSIISELLALGASVQNELLLTLSAMSMVFLTSAGTYTLIHLSTAPLTRVRWSDIRGALPAGLCILIVVILLWLPFGLKFTGILEEWIVRAFIEGIPSLAFTREMLIRPFEMLPHHLGNWITPDSFIGFNLVHAAQFWAKGIVFFAIVRRLTGRVELALAAGILLMLYPANDGLMTTRAMHIHSSVLYYLIAVYFLLEHWRQPRRITVLMMWAGIVLSLGTYEAGLTLMFFTPLLLIFTARRIDTAVIVAMLVWYIAPVFHVSRLIFLYSDGVEFYLRSQVDSLASAPQLEEMLDSGLRGIKRIFLLGWQFGYEQLQSNQYLVLGIIAAIVVGIGIRHYLSKTPVHSVTIRQSAALLLIAAIAIVVGLAMFLPTIYRNDSWRLYFFPPIGAALFFVVSSDLLSRSISWIWLRNWIFTLLISTLTLLAMVRLLNQHQYFVNIAHAQQRVLASVVEQVPALTPNFYPSVAYIIPPTPDFLEQHSLKELFINTVNHSALSYLYHGQIHAVLLCLESTAAQACTFNAEALHYEIFDYRYENLFIFELEDDGTVTLLDHIPPEYYAYPPEAHTPSATSPFANYNPSFLIDADAELSPRLQAILDNVVN